MVYRAASNQQLKFESCNVGHHRCDQNDILKCR